MDWQIIANVGLTLLLLGGGWFFKVLWDTIKSDRLTNENRDSKVHVILRQLEIRDDDIISKLNKINIDLPTNYVQKDDMNRLSDKIFDKFDKLEQDMKDLHKEILDAINKRD